MKKTIILNQDTESFLKITLSTEKLRFSVTGETKNSCGCIHDEILESRPDLKFLINLHLSDLDGVPMHAEENGFYWLAKAAGIEMLYEPEQSPEICLKQFCDHCRIDELVAKIIIDRVKEKFLYGKNLVATSELVSACTEQSRHKSGVEVARKEWFKICKGMHPRWKSEAELGLASMEVIN